MFETYHFVMQFRVASMTVEIVLKQELRIFWPQEPEQSTFSERLLLVCVRLKPSKKWFPIGFLKNQGFSCKEHI